MKSRDLRKPVSSHAPRSPFPSFVLVVCAVLSFAFVGCGAPGEPVPPSPPVPVAIADLSAQQAGDGVQLTFTLPAKTVSGDQLASPPAVEVVRGRPKPDGSPDRKSFRVVYTIPGALVSNYVSGGQLKFTDPIAPSETRAHPGGVLDYVVRTRLSKKRASADSNAVSVRMFPVPEPIAHVDVHVTESAIELIWSAPTLASGGEPLSAVSGYRVYRGELDPLLRRRGCSRSLQSQMEISSCPFGFPRRDLLPGPSL